MKTKAMVNLYAAFLLPCHILTFDAHSQPISKQVADTSFLSRTDAWHAHRIQALRAEDGWLNLAGLFWLKEGVNSFGSGALLDLTFPAGKIPLHAGKLIRKGYQVWLLTDEHTDVMVDGKPMHEALVFDTGSFKPRLMAHGSLAWMIIRRSDRIGVRLRDLKHPNLQEFHGIKRYPADPSWAVPAKLEKSAISKMIPITNVLGQTNLLPSPGRLIFSLKGKTYALDALEEGEELFVLFGDDTNGVDTYASGRFLYAQRPGPDGRTLLDFNRSINPPCAFTPFATCPLPPRQNMLPMEVKAGEKDYHAGH